MDTSNNNSSYSSSSTTLDQINTLFHRQLEQDEVLLLIEAGIKFFLYQRGQIPLPYDRLLSRSNSITTINLENDSSKNLTSSSSSSFSPPSSNTCPLEDEEQESTIQRIRKLKAQRKTTQKQMLIARRNMRYHQMEIKAHSILEDLFMCLRSVFLSQNCNCKSVVVFFGPSIFHHKEMITFDIDPFLRKTSTADTSNNGIQRSPAIVGKKSQDFSTIVRSFCKSIVMSSTFLGFTEKSLRATYTHIGIILDEELPEHLKTELILTENYESILSSSKNFVQTKKCKKSLRVNLKLQDTEEISNGTFEDSMPCEDDEENLKSYFYQIPLRFKGFCIRASQS